MTQFARPDSNITQTGITGGFADIDESIASDTDFAAGADNTAAELEVGLSNVTDPSTSSGHIVRVRLAKVDGGVFPGTGGNALTQTVLLLQGATPIATVVNAVTAPDAWTQTDYTLTSGEADAITDYTDLRIEMTTTASGGSPANRRGGAISWAVLEVPDPPSASTVNVHAQAQAYISQTFRAYSQAQASISGYTNASDDFSDDQTNTWANADNGGIWTTSVAGNGAVNNIDKISGKGVMTSTAGNSTLRVALQQVYVTNQDTLVKIQINKSPTGGTFQVFVDARYIDSANYYRAEIQFRTDGNIYGRIERILGGAYTNLTGSEPQISGLTFSIDTDYYVRFEAKGSGTTTLKMKVWQVGTDEPSTWHDTRTDTSAALQGASSIALQGWSNAHTDYTGDGLQFKWDDLTLNQWFGFAQAQAEITVDSDVTTVYSHAQSQADIKQTYYGLAQAQGSIKQTYNSHSQAQGSIKQTYPAHANTQARILTNYRAFAQAQAQIKQTYKVNAQSQATIKQTYFGLAQSQARIKQTYFGLAQANAAIGVTSFVHAQAQAWIKATYYANAQSQADIKATSRGYAQSQADIKQTYVAHAQANALISKTVFAYAQAQAQIKQIYLAHSQAQSWIEQAYLGFAQANAYIYRIEFGLAQAQGQIKQTYNAHAQAQGFIVLTTNVFAQAQATVKTTYYAHAQAEASILGDLIIGRGYAQAQAKINAFNINVHGQSQADIKQTYENYGQSQALITTTNQGYGQTQGTILQTYTAFAQTQALVKNTYQGFAQAQASIKTVSQAYGQAQALLGGISQGYGQSQGTILVTVNGYGQAQGTILQVYQQHGQAQAWVKITVNSCAQAQASIVIIGQGYAQAEAFILGANFGYAQARAVIVTTNTMGTLSISDRASINLELSDHADEEDIDSIQVELSDRASFAVTLTDRAY